MMSRTSQREMRHAWPAAQASVYTVACGPIIQTMGVPVASDMYAPAVSYLSIKALGTPAATMWLVVNGIFRGLGDTTTPLKWALVFTGLNALLVPFFIFTLVPLFRRSLSVGKAETDTQRD